ncbi:hypothetical protein [Photobacterium rosenbergii]|uniref:hypothetical protein n=1 Tax=Photobacterium rosenbergii TaxID=294936 RepID=UPI001C9974E7|nr:hypothetical protein [Photobacterium rosenbergii]MBY5948773.1 hypothetical protein [Photobacterium rosenbergii]
MSDLMQVRLVNGTCHYVKKSEMDDLERFLNVFTSQGKQVIDDFDQPVVIQKFSISEPVLRHEPRTNLYQQDTNVITPNIDCEKTRLKFDSTENEIESFQIERIITHQSPTYAIGNQRAVKS